MSADPAMTAPAAPPVPVATTAPTAPAAPTASLRRRRTVVLAVGRRLARMAMVAALLVAGGYAGWQFYLGNQPATGFMGDPAVVGVPTPPIVGELVLAIAADDSDAIRAALAPDIFSSYTADLQNFGITQIVAVDTLGTYVDGPRTATELVLHGRDATRNPFSMNLVVLTEDGVIVRLR